MGEEGERGWGCLNVDVQCQGGGKRLDVDGQGVWGVLKIRQFSWMTYVYRPLLHPSVIFYELVRFHCLIVLTS